MLSHRLEFEEVRGLKGIKTATVNLHGRDLRVSCWAAAVRGTRAPRCRSRAHTLVLSIAPPFPQVAVAHGGKSLHAVCQQTLAALDRSEPPPFDFVEMMACRGGCIGGGGNPKDAVSTDLLQQRARGIYSVDEAKRVRRSHENTSVQALYREHLGAPGSSEAHRLLHTRYSPRVPDGTRQQQQ